MNGKLTVRSSIFLRFLYSSVDSWAAPGLGFFGFMMRWKLKMTSSAVSGFPSWNVTPERNRTVHSVAVAFGVISSARAS